MKYSKELHDTLVKSNYYDSHIINALLDEIDRLHNQVTDYLAVNAELVEKYERLQSERRWIPVSERLPEDNGTEISEAVLTCYETNGGSGAVTIRGLLNTGMWFDTSTGFLVNPANVTHWMPLPEPPESEG